MRKTMVTTGLSLAMLGASCLTTATAAQAAPTVVEGPDQFKVQLVSLAGTGCRPERPR